MKTQVKYTTMIVKDMEESVRFYRDVMGFEVDSTYRLPPQGDPVVGGITLMRSEEGDTMVELIENSEMVDGVRKYPVGFYSIGMEVKDMDEAMCTLKARGAKILAKPQPTAPGSCAFIEDPNGVRIAIIYHR